MSLSSDALTPARVEDIMAGLRVAPPKEANRNIDPATGKPRRGRPPGSKNRPKDASAPEATAASGDTRVRIPSGIPRPVIDREKELADKRKLKEARQKKIADYLTGDFSEQALEMLISATPIPADMIFTKEAPATKRSKNPNLTQLGQRFAVPPDVADAWATVIAELSTTGGGSKIAESFESGNLGLILACLMCFITTGRWARQLRNDWETLQTLIEKMAEAQGQHAEGGVPIA